MIAGYDLGSTGDYTIVVFDESEGTSTGTAYFREQEETYTHITYIQQPKEIYKEFRQPIRKQCFGIPENDGRKPIMSPTRPIVNRKIMRCNRKGIGLRIRSI